MSKALLLRVGIDKGCGGSLAPLFTDGSFEYIPIPELKPTSYPRNYDSIIGRSGQPLGDYVPSKLRTATPHFDPEFETCTYGDPTPTKRQQLLQLNRGDLLVFYAGLRPWPKLDIGRLYIIGVLEVERALDLPNTSLDEHPRLRVRIGNNAHFFRRAPDKNLVVVQGNRANSRLLDKALPLGDAAHAMLPDLHDTIDYEGSILRAVGHWIRGDQPVAALRGWLNRGPENLVVSGTRLFSYVVTHDTGFAPNPHGGYCTLATCKPKVRKSARVGDWVVGMCPARVGSTKVVYVMRVNEALTFDEYFRDERFAAKKPAAIRYGDNIYHRQANGRFRQVPNEHHNRENLARDTSADRVLISSLYWYFGSDAVNLPKHLRRAISHPYIGHKEIREEDVVRKFVSWVSSNFRMGVLGPPRDNGPGKKPNRRHARKRRRC